MFEWLTDCLRDPSGTYELITPTRRPLVTSMGTVRAADLLPSVRCCHGFRANAWNQLRRWTRSH